MISDLEWSGVLFYTYEGDFSSTESPLIIHCVDFLPMDIGNAGATEFEITEDVIAYMMDKDLLDCKSGLIHSHHTMSTFFSQTDLNTLASEGTYMQNFVSLIVNNKGSYTAGITRKIKERRKISSIGEASFFEQDSINLPKSTSEDIIEYVEWFSLQIEKEEYIPDASIQELESRLQELKITKTKASKLKKKTFNSKPSKSFSQPLVPVQQPLDLFEDSEDLLCDDYFPFQPYYPKEDFNTGIWQQDDFYDSIDYSILPVNQLLLQDILAQIVTGDINFFPSNSFNLKSYLEEKMEEIYESRFKSADDPLFKDDFAETLIEILMIDIQDPDLQAEGLDSVDIGGTYAYHILLQLESYESNPYLDVYKNILNNYLEL